MSNYSEYKIVKKKQEFIFKLLFVLPPVIGFLAAGLNILITDNFSNTTAILFWFGTVLILLSISGDSVRKGFDYQFTEEQVKDLLDLHIQFLSPGLWLIILLVHSFMVAIPIVFLL